MLIFHAVFFKQGSIKTHIQKRKENMPKCKAESVLKGKDISYFTIPDPKINRPLSEQSIHNLWIENLEKSLI